jgi:hypothetical protein
MENHKDSNSYYLDTDIISWLSEEAAKKDRSASWYLNEILRKMKEKK